MSESLFDKKETPTQMFFYEFCDIFMDIFFYRSHPVAVSRLNLSNFSNLRKKKYPCKCLLKCEGKIGAFIKILHRF